MKKKLNNLNLKKVHSKRSLTGKKNIYINIFFFYNLYNKLNNSPRKTKRWIYRRLSRRRLIINMRKFFLKQYLLEKKFEFNYYSKFFYRFNFISFISLDYYKLTDYQLELIRRLVRKTFGKRVFIKLLINITFIILRRTNQIRMGGGKGNKFFKKVYFLYPGCSFLEVRGVRAHLILILFKKLKKKLPFLFKILILNRC
jgi:ribosomal protein L16/L10AE